jgi:small subunit ribosomal protein S2
MSEISLVTLLEAGLQFGHKAFSWNPKMFPYIHKEQNNIHILDLVQSVKLLNQANIYCRNAAKQGKVFLFVGTNKHIKSIIFDVAKQTKSFYVNERWLGGILTNWVTLKERIKYLKTLENQVFKNLSKKEASAKRKKLEKIRKYLNGIKEMDVLPDVVVIIDSNKEITAIKECQELKIPIISILDTNCNPDLIDIPIPGNDDSIQSVKVILNSLTNNIILGQRQNLI